MREWEVSPEGNLKKSWGREDTVPGLLTLSVSVLFVPEAF